jgi:hypothetical protein
MTADAWEPVDFLAEFREREACCREAIQFLTAEARSNEAEMWAHHLPRMVEALEFGSRVKGEL